MEKLTNKEGEPLLTLAELGEMRDYNPDYLRQLAAGGLLEGAVNIGGRLWLATERALDEYQTGWKGDGRPRRGGSSRRSEA